MKANELRIGNLVNCSFEDAVTISAITQPERDIFDFEVKDAQGLFTEVMDGIRPIALTEEWLDKFGFKKTKGDIPYYTYYVIKELPSFPSYIDDKGNFHWFSTVLPNIGKIKYVHQLQNLYFALTGKELTISSTPQ